MSRSGNGSNLQRIAIRVAVIDKHIQKGGRILIDRKRII